MSCRRRTGDSSLELLLDTITNTFGGVLFLAILVSLLLRTASPTASSQSAAAAAISVSEQAAYEVRLVDLQDQLARLQRPRTPDLASVSDSQPDTSKEEAERLSAELAAAVHERATIALHTAASQREREAAMEEIARLVDRRAVAAEQLSRAKAAMNAAMAESKRLVQARLTLERNSKPTTIEQTVGMPTLRETQKQQVAVLLRFGRLYMTHRWKDGVRLGPNPDHFVVTPGTPPVARPKPGAGIAVSAETVTSELRRLLRPFPEARWVVAVVVFHDSFVEFQILKQAIVEAGYEYNPIPVEPGGSVVDAGGARRAQ